MGGAPSYLADWLLLAAGGVGILLEYLFWTAHVRPYQAADLVDGRFAFNDNKYQFPVREETFDMVVTPIVSFALPILLFATYRAGRHIPALEFAFLCN